MTKIILDGRKDIDAFFEHIDVFNSERLTHNPFLIFIASEASVTVRIINKPNKLLSFPDDTPVMGQWPGQYRSDYFQFTVGQYRPYAEAKYGLLKSAKNVIKFIGPKGGFRLLSYKYENEQGIIESEQINSKADADIIEEIFDKQKIPVTIQNITKYKILSKINMEPSD